MLIKELANRLNKEVLYDYYQNMVTQPAVYEKITRAKMLTTLYDLYTQDDALFHLLDYAEFKLLKEFVKNPEKLQQNRNTIAYSSLFKKYLLLYDFNEVVIPDEIKTAVKITEQKYKQKDFIKKDNINQTMIGILRCYGILTLQDLRIVCDNYHMCMDTLEDYFRTTLYLKPYIFLYERNNKPYLVMNNEMESYIDEIINIQKEGIPHTEERALDDILAIAKYGVNTNVPSIAKLYKSLQQPKLLGIKEYFWDEFLYHVHTCKDPKDFINELSDMLCFDEELLSSLTETIIDAYLHTPSASLFGCTPLEYSAFLDANDYSVQEDACLSEKDTAIFYELYFALLEYTNKKFKVVKGLKKIYHCEHVDPQHTAKIRDVLFENRSVIDEFVRKNPFHFNKAYLALVKNFKYAIKSMGIIIKYEPQYTIISMEDGNFYAVLGLTTNIDEVIPMEQLPYSAQFTLLPWRDKIIYDGMILGFAIKIGNNMKKNLEEELAKSTLITSMKPFQA